MERIEFTVPGLSTGQGRARFARVGKGVRTYERTEDMEAKDRVGWYFMQAAPNHKLWVGPVEMRIECTFPWPKSWPRWMREWAAAERRLYLKKPDASNVLKLVEDALGSPKRQVAMRDDCVVTPDGPHRYYVQSDDEPPCMLVRMTHRPELLPTKPTEKRR